MSTFTTLFCALLISTISADAGNATDIAEEIGIVSALFMKSRISEYATPFNVCYARNINTRGRSMKLLCEERCYYDFDLEKDVCERDAVAYKYTGEVCDDDGTQAFSTNRFKHKDKGGYPYNCYQDREREGHSVNPNDYVTPHMIVKLEYGLLLEDVNMTFNYTNEDNETETDWRYVDECVKKPNQTFYRSFAAITDKCFLAWRGQNPRWFMAECSNDGFRLRQYDAYGCTNDSEIIIAGRWPFYQPNGCRARTWLDQHWYTEVVKCTHPKLINFAKACHYYGHINISLSFIIFMIIYMIIN